MTASLALQSAIIDVLNGVEGVTASYDGAPPRAAFPYVTVDASSETDWGHKTGEGREIALAVTLWDDVPDRLMHLSAQVEVALNAIPLVPGWQLVSLRFARRRTVRAVSGPWASALDYRARLLLLQGE
jgi:Protein of unknown function (DUF3168)